MLGRESGIITTSFYSSDRYNALITRDDHENNVEEGSHE